MVSEPKPLFSIVIATLNSATTLERCLESIHNQTFKDHEVVVWDGGSSDATIDILKRWNTRFETGKDRGIYDAWNKALTRVRGEWVLFLGSDDYLWTSTVLETLASPLRTALPKYRIVYGTVRVVTSEGSVLEDVGKPWKQLARQFQKEMCLPHQGTFHHCSLFNEYGNFDATFRITGDYEFLLRELKTREAMFVPGVIVAGMQFGGISSQLSSTLRNINELQLARTKNGIRSPSLPLMGRKVRARSRQFIQRVLGQGVSDWVADQYRALTGKPKIWTRVRGSK